MINKKYLYIIPIIVFTFIFGVNNVKAENIKHIEYVESYTGYSFEYDLDIEEYPYYALGINANYIDNVPSFRFELIYSKSSFYFKYINNKGNPTDNGWLYSINSSTKYNFVHKTIKLTNKNVSTTTGTSQKISYVGNYNDMSNSLSNFYNNSSFSQYGSIFTGGLFLVDINHDIYDSSNNLIISKDYINNNGYISIPDIFIELKEDLKDSNDNIIGKVLQTSVSQLDDLKYNYYYRINDNEWNLIDSTNFVSNSFYYELKENGTYYFKIEDKEDNYVNSATFTISDIDIFSSLESEEVDYEYTNENGVKTTYNKLLKIPISSFYDFEKGKFKGFQFVFLTKSKTDFSSEFLIEYHNKTNVSGIDIPLQIKFLENLEDFTTINSDTMVGSSGISHSSGGGRHEGVIQECKITKLPYQHNIYNDNTNYYNVLQFIPTNCTNDFNYSLSDFRNDYIYVYYNARVYKDLSSLKEDYETNKNNYENDNPESFVNSVTQALSYFLKPIKEIFKLVTYFFNNLPFQIRYMFMAIFVIGIILIVFKLFF